MVGSSHGKSSVDITATAKNHSEYISELLAGHALSGCDTVACLFGIGKGTIIKILKRGYKLRLLGDLNTQIADVIKQATLFVQLAMDHKQDKTCLQFVLMYDHQRWPIKT